MVEGRGCVCVCVYMEMYEWGMRMLRISVE